MKKGSLLKTCKDVKFDVFEKKIGQGFFFVLLVLGTIFILSSVFFWGEIDFVLRALFGLLVVRFAIWGIKDSKK